jgi:hypothetical protein
MEAAENRATSFQLDIGADLNLDRAVGEPGKEYVLPYIQFQHTPAHDSCSLGPQHAISKM